MLAALLLVQAAIAELPPSVADVANPAAAAPCEGKLYQAFDFWLGAWNVFDRETGEPQGSSRIEKINDECALRENWTSRKGVPGGSLNAPDLITGRWHQYWIDSVGQRVDLEGGLFSGTMVLAGPWQRPGTVGQNQILRITYSRLDGDSVRQLAEVSADGGLTWETSSDHLYLREARED